MPNVSRKQLKVLIGTNYLYQKTVDLGQTNVTLKRRRLNFPAKILPNASSFTIAEPTHDLIHTVNCVPLFATCPYIVTVESFLPRMWPKGSLNNWFFDVLRHHLSSHKCAKILPMSQFAIRMMTMQNKGYEGWPSIAKKIDLFYPSATSKNILPKPMVDKKIKLLAVGRDFMRKGFPSITRAHNKLKKLGLDVETTIVSGLRWSKSDFIGPQSEHLFLDEIRQLKTSSIKSHLSLSNKDVIALMAESHFLLLPTLHDSFGFVSIEALSVGTPVIATAVCAQPEIVSDKENGFLIPIETEPETGTWSWFGRNNHPDYTDAYMNQVESAADTIVATIANFANHIDSYKTLSANAIQTAQTKFNLDIQRRRLEDLYDEICG
mgnify:CR=1 FL=1